VTLYAAITVILTAQALMGQSIVKPDATVIAVTSVVLAAAGSAIAIDVVTQRAKLTQ
jgi:hypothetical protein